jgi:hypothetical protein
MTHRSLLALMALSLAFHGCFDVRKVPLPRFVIDDFEDADFRPKPDAFDDWACRAFTTPLDGGATGDPDAGAPGVDCVVESVGEHARAMTMRFDLEDPADGAQQFGGAVLFTTAAGATKLDLGAFKELVLSAVLESGSRALPPGTQLRVEIGCTLLGRPVTIAMGVPNLAIGSDWETFALSLAQFAPAEPSCLNQVDALRISVRPGLADGTSTRSALHVDDIYLN